jgi:hypothetical protein
MAIVIDEIQTDVQMDTAAPGGAAAGHEAPPLWQQVAQLRMVQGTLLTDDARTQAIGNDTGNLD